MFTKKILLCVSYLVIALIPEFQSQEVPGIISEKKCDEFYWEYSWDLCKSCGRGGGGGQDVPEGVYTHMAALGYGEEPNIKWRGCGGSLISSTFVLTAAHCLRESEHGALTHVRLGVVKLHVNNGTNVPQDISILRTYTHPEYKPPLVYNDIALLELSEAPVFGFNVYPACLNTKPELDATKLLSATGWGALKHNGKYPDHMQLLYLHEQSHEICAKLYNKNNKRRLNRGIDDATQVCAGRNGVDSCDGDSGGPLQIQSSKYIKGYTIVGVTSFGKPCLVANTPGVYTRVLPYLDWIESVVWKS